MGVSYETNKIGKGFAMDRDFRHCLIEVVLMLLLFVVLGVGSLLAVIALHNVIRETLGASANTEHCAVEWQDIELSGTEVLYQGPQYIGTFDVNTVHLSSRVYQVGAYLSGTEKMGVLLCEQCGELSPGDQVTVRVVLGKATPDGDPVFVVVQIVEVIRGQAA